MTDEIQTPAIWCEQFDIHILDPDGWRADGQAWDAPVALSEFLDRASMSTASGDFTKLREALRAKRDAEAESDLCRCGHMWVDHDMYGCWHYAEGDADFCACGKVAE